MMIQKFRWINERDITTTENQISLQRKINELVDAVNAIQKEREAERFEIQEWIGILEAVRKSVNIHEKQIDELQMKVEPEKCKPAENGKFAKNAQDETPRCPFCQQELEIGGVDGILRGCPKCRNFGTEMLWQELIRTRKTLGIAVDALKTVRRYTAINQFAPKSREAHIVAKKALAEITTLEQKD